MCQQNAAPIELSWNEWRAVFKDGVPAAYFTNTDSLTTMSFSGFKKGAEKKAMSAAIEKNARAAKKDELYHCGMIFT